MLWIRKNKRIASLINHQPDIDKIYHYAKDPSEARYQFLINKRENVGLDHFNDSKYSSHVQDVSKY